MSEGWGKRAANRIDRTQFQQDELLKSLGTQFNVDFSSYDQWKRQNRALRTPARPPTSRDDFSFTVGHIDSASCRHSSFREKRQAAKLEELHRQRSERIKILELRLQTRRKTLSEYEQRYKELLDENIKLKNLIDKDESHTHDSVKTELRKFEMYKGGMTVLSSNFVKHLEETKQDLQDTKERLTNSISGLEKQVNEVEEELKTQQNQLSVLNSYKDKEYPVKAMQISNLQTDIENLKLSNQEDQEDLEHIINTEIGKYHKNKVQLSNQITQAVTERAVSMMHPSLKDMALQNMVMEKEIEFHTHQQQDLQQSIRVLEAEVRCLLSDPRTNARQQMFPEFFPQRPKCTPDMEVVLDIPTQEWLPI